VAELRIDHLSKAFGEKRVLDDVSFDLPSGDIMSVIGPSGGGKTTLFRCILGDLRPDAGRVSIDGDDVTRVAPDKRGVGVVFQSYALFPHMSVRENVAYGLRMRRVKRDQRDARVEEMLRLVQLERRGEERPDTLSGGERQRVALARALAVEPRLLLLDEAFTALDATTRSQVIQEVRRIIKSLGVTTLLITHDQEEAFLFSRRVLVLNAGRVVTVDEPTRVMRHPHPFIQDFVKMCLIQEAKVETYSSGQLFVTAEGGAQIPIQIPGVAPGDVVHVMVKKGPTQRIEVWPADEARE
jgi:ABC-type Fe3+/spermidine/putrescine transport system ATPase subunit